MQERPVYVTEQGRLELIKELEQLRTVERPRVIDHLHEVKSGGDWMENTEVMLFENELTLVDRRIQELESMLRDAQVIEQDSDTTVVNIGDTVVIQDEYGESETYRIVGVAEANPSDGLISNESPAGKALLKHHVGDEIVVEAPAGEIKYRILAVK
jgi:transcription elongation factor GreA